MTFTMRYPLTVLAFLLLSHALSHPESAASPAPVEPASNVFMAAAGVWTRGDVTAEKNTPPLGCLEACAGDTEDWDRDGLSACVEDCYGITDLFLDSDADGMPDPFEVQYNLNPLEDDSLEDPDRDLLANVREYIGGSSPTDPASPSRVYYVATNGVDQAGGGSRTAPWRTLNYAVVRVASTVADPARIALRAGTYTEDVVMTPGLQISGAEPGAVIEGQVTGARSSGLTGLEVRAAGSGAVLLDMDGVAMQLVNVVFRGLPDRDGTGILVDGTAPVGSQIEQCTFTDLNVGIDIGDAIPLIRRTVFTVIGDAGIILRAPGSDAPSNDLGDAADPETGWNTFDLETITGHAIVNERSVAVLIQLNDWGTDDPRKIVVSISGPAVFQPFKAAGSAILAAAIYCTVWADQEPVLDAAAELEGSGYPAVVENMNGVYAFPSVAEGEYALAITTPGFEEAVLIVDVHAGEVKSLTVALARPGENEPRRRFCNRRPDTRGEGGGTGDAVLVGFLGVALLVGRRRW